MKARISIDKGLYSCSKEYHKEYWKRYRDEKMSDPAYVEKRKESIRLSRLKHPETVHKWRRKYATSKNGKAMHRAYISTDKAKHNDRRYKLKKTYGISLDRYNEILADQNGGCAICNETISTTRCKNLFIDHDHETGHVRGILCMKCNMALGLVKDNYYLLQKMAAYTLERCS